MKPVQTIGQAAVRLSNRLPVRAQAVPAQNAYPPHDHEFYEICLVTAGRALHRTVDGDEWLERGSVVIVAPGQLHEFAKVRRFAVVNVYYLAEWFLADLQTLRQLEGLVRLFFQRALFPSGERGGVVHLQLREGELAGCLADLADMEAEGSLAEGEVQPLFLEAGLLKCLVRLTRAWAREDGVGGRLDWPVAVWRGIAAIERVVRTGGPLEVRAVAREAGASFSHFCRLFKAATGLSAGGYYQRRRIHRACRRLLTSRETVAEIAHALGFADSAHFNRHFKAAQGLTPSAYRNKFACS